MAAIGASGEDQGNGRRGGMIPTIGAVVILTLLAGGGGALLGTLLGKPAASTTHPVEPAKAEVGAVHAPSADAEETSASEATTKVSPGGSTYTMLDLEPVLTNIYAPAGTWLRVEAKLVVKSDMEADPALLTAQVGADTMALLRSVQLSQIEGTRGLMHLRDDLRERAKLRSPAVVDYLIQSLVAE